MSSGADEWTVADLLCQRRWAFVDAVSVRFCLVICGVALVSPLFDASSVPFLCSGAKRASLPSLTRKMHELALSDSKNARSVSICSVRLGI